MYNKEFKKLGEYRQAKADKKAKAGELQDRLNAAQTKLTEVKKARQELINKMVNGENVTEEELEKAQADITKADSQLQTTRELQMAFYAVKSYSVTEEEVVSAFNNEYLAEYKAEYHEPLMEKLFELKLAYIAIYLEHKRSVDYINDYISEIAYETGDKYRYKLHNVEVKTRQEEEKLFMTADETLRFLQWGKVPDNIRSEYKSYINKEEK